VPGAANTDSFDAIVLGAGGAGLMCAAVAGQRARRVLLIDHADEAGKKILISGGGRCNFTNVNAGPENYLSANPHFMKSALRRYTPADFHRAGRSARDRLAREDARSIVLRRVGAADRGDAACRVQQRGGLAAAWRRSAKSAMPTACFGECRGADRQAPRRWYRDRRPVDPEAWSDRFRL
jgi:anaerobic glycerol-3-phosphate dehydrogenase